MSWGDEAQAVLDMFWGPVLVRRDLDAGLSVWFVDWSDPRSEPELPAVKKVAVVDAQDVCACGHQMVEHNSGFCMHACDPLKCSPEDAK